MISFKLAPFTCTSSHSGEKNYNILNKELLAIKATFKECQHLLMDTKFPIHVFTSHKHLEDLKMSQHLNQQQMDWSLFFTPFDFVEIYCPGTMNGKEDVLS